MVNKCLSYKYFCSILSLSGIYMYIIIFVQEDLNVFSVYVCLSKYNFKTKL